MDMSRYARAALASSALALVLALVACGGGDESVEPIITPAAPVASATASVAVDPEPPASSAPAASAPAATKPKAGGGDPTGLLECCVSLRQNAKSAPDDQKGAYERAADVCDGVVRSPQARQALGQVRSVLQSAKVPASCQ